MNNIRCDFRELIRKTQKELAVADDKLFGFSDLYPSINGVKIMEDKYNAQRKSFK